MALIRMVQKVFIASIFAIFAASVLILLSLGAGAGLAMLMSFFNMIGADFPLNTALAGSQSAAMLLFYTVGIFGRFAFAVILTSIFYQLLGSVDISGRVIEARTKGLSHHVVIAPANDISIELARKLKENHIPYIIVDRRRAMASKLNRKGLLSIHSEVLGDFAMRRAHVERAHALMLLDDDIINNTLVALAAKKVNYKLKIAARVKNIEDIPKMSRVGVGRIVIPESAAGIDIGRYISSVV